MTIRNLIEKIAKVLLRKVSKISSIIKENERRITRKEDDPSFNEKRVPLLNLLSHRIRETREH